jgi:hypothetical protein
MALGTTTADVAASWRKPFDTVRYTPSRHTKQTRHAPSCGASDYHRRAATARQSIIPLNHSLNKIGKHMIITDTDLQNMIAKLSANRDESANVVTFAAAVAAAARDADGKRLEMLRTVRAMARRLGVELPENEKIDLRQINKMLLGEDTLERMAFKSALHRAGLI